MPVFLTVILLVVVLSSLVFLLLGSQNEKFSFIKTIHREKNFGAIISAGTIVWAGIQGHQLLSQDFPLVSSIIPILVPVLIAGVYFLMDYIFTRAIGALLVMLVCEVFYVSQAHDMPGRWLFSLIGYAVAIGAMFMIGQPWRFRDVLAKAGADKTFARRSALVLAILILLMFAPFALAYV